MGQAPRIVIAGWAGAGNTGDELLTAWAVAAVREAGGTAIVLSVDPGDTSRRHATESVAAMSWSAMRVLVGADGLVVGPGGILQDATSLWSLPAHLLRPALANLRSIPMVGAGLGVGPIIRRGSGLMLRRSLKAALRVVVRDSRSAGLLAEVGVDVDVAPDAVFAAAPKIDNTKAEPDRIIVSLRNTQVVGQVRIAKFRESSPDLAGWASSLSALRQHLGVPIRFVAFDPERDRDLHTHLADMVGNCEVVEVDERSAPSEMKRAVVAVAGRYHAAVLAAAYGRPFVTLDQGAKLPALQQMIGDGGAAVAADAGAEEMCSGADLALSGASSLPAAAARAATQAEAHTDAIRLLVKAAG